MNLCVLLCYLLDKNKIGKHAKDAVNEYEEAIREETTRVIKNNSMQMQELTSSTESNVRRCCIERV